MSQILSLISDPARVPLDPRLVAEVGAAVRSRPVWLADDEACEFACEAVDAGAVRRLLGDAPVDVAVMPAVERRKQLLVTDMDSTIITVECVDEMADLIGKKAEVAAITRRAMNGELDFRSALAERVALFAGLDEDVLRRVHRERVRLMPGARALVRTMRAHGAVTALVSGGFEPIVGDVARELGFDHAIANRLEVENGRLTGRLLEPVRDGRTKLEVLLDLRERLGLEAAATMAAGDGANDLPMLEAAGLGVAFHAHPRVKDRARVTIDHGDLTALLYLQGMPRRDFVD